MVRIRPGRPPAVTQKDVAKRAGVTQATVSLVINNSNRINPATRLRVEQAIRELGYATNLVARSLVTRNTHVLSLVTPALSADSEHFMMPLLQGILKGLEEEDYLLNYSQGPSGKTTIEAVQKEVKKTRAAGIFIVSPHREESSYLEFLLGENIPFVLVNRRHEDHQVACVAVDYAEIAYRAICHLHRKGHRRIGFINGPPDRPSCRERLRGVRTAFLELELILDERDLIAHGNFQLDGGYRGMKKLLAVDPPPTAVFAGNDFQALGAIQAIHEAGRKVPGDVAVIGCDDWQMSSWIRPPLTTVRVPFHEMGVIAAHQLCKLVRGEPVTSRQIILPSQLIERESV
jgi:LacI family repressor for deo operon, udp, cdd, tsx, nupC, and nupG